MNEIIKQYSRPAIGTPLYNELAGIGKLLADKKGLTVPYTVPQVIALAKESLKREENLT